MKQLGHTDFRPNIARITEAVEVTTHGDTMGYWLPKGSPEAKAFLAAVPQKPPPQRVQRLEPLSPRSSPHDEARQRREVPKPVVPVDPAEVRRQQQVQRDEVLRKVARQE